ncbi:MAG TPA: hypothetical protein VEE84_07475, partial [Burkholderiaceae bacterium]|nr:hypothetical protein [Burkholderiaceae bacterium]
MGAVCTRCVVPLLVALVAPLGAMAQESATSASNTGAIEATAQAAPPAQAADAGSHRLDPSTLSFIPIPEIDTAPFSGVTLGL